MSTYDGKYCGYCTHPNSKIADSVDLDKPHMS